MRSMSEFPQFYDARETSQKFVIRESQYKLPEITKVGHKTVTSKCKLTWNLTFFIYSQWNSNIRVEIFVK